MTVDLIAELIAVEGAGLMVVDLAADAAPTAKPGRLRVGVDWTGRAPVVDPEAFDILLSAAPSATAPFVAFAPEGLDAALNHLDRAAAAWPVASTVCAQVLRLSAHLPFDDALLLESLAYSMLLTGTEFRGWRAARPLRLRPVDTASRVTVEAGEQRLAITLDRAWARNAIDARMRDDLVEALTFACEHPDAPPVELSGAGPSFCAGGDLDEFGSAEDLALAHLVRTLRSPARLARALGSRLTARLHGHCIGGGLEIAAAAGFVEASPDTVFWLPEVAMGLIPGAGGTATIPRRIGRHRTCWLAISGAQLDAETARAWGLIDEISP